MEAQTYRRKNLSVSHISTLGVCETKVLDSILGKRPPTPVMKEGALAHRKLEKTVAPLTRDEIVSRMGLQWKFDAREVTVVDERLHLIGRIDHLSMTGIMEEGRNTCTIIDDKFPGDPSKRIYGLTLYYKLQLASYAAAIAGSSDYGSACKPVGASLIYRSKETGEIMGQFDMDRNRLGACTANVGTAVDDAWKLYRQETEPEHRRFDVESGEWVGCYCDTK